MNHEDKNIIHYLYGDDIGSVSLVESYGTDLTIVNAARVSFGVKKDNVDERDQKLIKYLVDHRHTSTFEHCGATFRFVVPLFVRSQHMRHRTWSYNEISRRYTDKDLQFYMPNSFRTQHKTNRQASNLELINPPIVPDLSDFGHGILADVAINNHVKSSLTLFHRLITEGVCREQARMVLPQNLYTEYYGTCCLSNLLKFISLRTHEGAQWEIQKVAEACLEISKSLWPEAVGAFTSER